MLIPVATFLMELDEDDDLSKIMLQASFDGRLKSDEGFLSTTGDLATLTAASGKDLYVTSAKVVFYLNTVSQSSLGDDVVLKINGTIVETSKASMGMGSVSGNSTVVYEFENMWHTVAATEIMKLEVIGLDGDTDVEGFIQAIEVPTGENPATYIGA